jgi:hypothetical protein
VLILSYEKRKTGLSRLFFTISLAMRKGRQEDYNSDQTLLSFLLLSFEKGKKERQDFSDSSFPYP